MKLTIRCGGWIFSPGLISSFFTLLLVPLFVYLGCWQLQRGEFKTNALKQLERRLQEPTLNDIPRALMTETEEREAELDTLRYRRLKTTGTFLNHQQILLDNQIFEGKVGYRVITPFQTEDKHILLVDRGWIPIGKNRNELPSITPILDKVSVQGIVQQFAHGLKLKKIHHTQNLWPLIVQHIDFKELSFIFANLVPFVLQMQAPASWVYTIPPLSFGIPPSRHLGYAVQWFGLAIGALIYYLIVNSRKKNVANVSA